MQKTKTITGVLLSVNPHNAKAEAKIVTYQDCLEEMYQLIGCDCFDVVVLKLGDQYVDAFVDDEGLMKEHPIVITHIGGRQLAGNILMIGHDKSGYSKSLTEDQLEAIKAVINNGITSFVLE